MRNPLCTLASRLPGEWPAAAATHRGNCLRCQAEAARDRAVRRGLAALAHELVPAPGSLKDGVLRGLGKQDAADPRRALVARITARHAAAAGLAAATLVALGAGVLRRHSRALG